MKTQKKVAVSIIGAMISLALCASSASAVLCANAEITKLGQRPAMSSDPNSATDDFSVFLKCPGWTNSRRYFLSPDLGDAGYATLLTAYSLGRNVDVYLADWTWNSLVTDIYLLPAP